MAMKSKLEAMLRRGYSRKSSFDATDATALFKKSLRNYPFEEFCQIAKDHSEGKLWVIGGFVYKNIIQQLYGKSFEEGPIDIDFLTEGHAREISRPEGWELERTSIGDLSLVKGEQYRIDLNGLVNFHSITSRGLPPEIQHFYTYNPLNIQAISYDCDRMIVEGEAAIDAIKRKIVKVNNLAELKWEAGRLSRLTDSYITPDDLIKAKAKELGFEYKLPWFSG